MLGILQLIRAINFFNYYRHNIFVQDLFSIETIQNALYVHVIFIFLFLHKSNLNFECMCACVCVKIIFKIPQVSRCRWHLRSWHLRMQVGEKKRVAIREHHQ